MADALGRFARSIASWLAVGLVTLVLCEVTLRVFSPARLNLTPGADNSGEAVFFRADRHLGWSFVPNVTSVFTNGAFKGTVHVDGRGLRLNAARSTEIAGARNIFVIGDSNTVAMEVDDEKAFPALLEQRLRARGSQVNVLNLGVRGYGTDQSVLHAISRRDLEPTRIVYLYTNNDLFDNSLLRRPARTYGKGLFVRWSADSPFVPYNYPVPDYPKRYVGLVALDDQCEPYLHEGTMPEPVQRVSRGGIPNWVPKYFWTFRAYDLLRWGPPPSWIGQKGVDPYQEITERGVTWHERFYLAYLEKGPLRNRCPEYFEAQMAHLLRMLRSIASVRGVYVVHFPDAEVMPEMQAGRVLPTVEMFQRLGSESIVNGYLNLGTRLVEAGIPYSDFKCVGDDWHFCEKGQVWMADEIEKALGRELVDQSR
jgi:lysophospholipase L1-like esterase